MVQPGEVVKGPRHTELDDCKSYSLIGLIGRNVKTVKVTGAGSGTSVKAVGD